MPAGKYTKVGFWTPEEDDVIRACHADGMSDTETQMLLPTRTVGAVHIRRLYGLQLKKWELKRFTSEQVEWLKQAYLSHMQLDEMANHLGHSIGTIRQKILSLGLKRDMRKTWLAKRYGADVLSINEDPAVIRHVMQDISRKEQDAIKSERQNKIDTALDAMLTDLSEGGDRKAALRAARLSGATLDQIGKQLGLTRERVRQITHDIKPNGMRRKQALEPGRARTVICVRCTQPFTVESRGAFKYCSVCYPVRQGEYRAESIAKAKVWREANPGKYRASQKNAYYKRKDALELVRAIEAHPDLMQEVRNKLLKE